MTEQPDYDIPGQTSDPIDSLIDPVEPDSSEPQQEPAPEPVKPRRKPAKAKPTKPVYKPFHW